MLNVNKKTIRRNLATCLAGLLLTVSYQASAAVLYSNGFETDISGWDAFGGAFDATRVASGTNGVTSASGSFHAESSTSTSPTVGGSAGNWGGYNYGAGSGVATVFQEYQTSVDIFLDVGGGWANDTRFDFDSAINNSSGDFLRDFIFNAGFYDSTDVTGPGAGTDRFVISASNNSSPGSAFPKNPGRDPIAISASGWYTFEHHFFDDGGALAVAMSIFDSTSTLINMWTLSDPLDLIAGVGGNRYGWFTDQDFSVLAFDNSSLETIDATVPEPSTITLLALGLAGLGFTRRRMKT